MVNLNSVNSLKKGVLNLCFQICVVVFFSGKDTDQESIFSANNFKGYVF